MSTVSSLRTIVTWFAVFSLALCSIWTLHITFTSDVQFKTESPRERRYICQTFLGRLGNHIFQYASVYAISRIIHATVILGKNDDLVQYFEVPSAEIWENRDICNTFVKKNSIYCCVFDETFMHLNKSFNYTIGEYLQSWKYFRHVFKEVRKELTVKRTIMNTVDKIISNYTSWYTLRNSSKAILVGVHIRRGDLVTDKMYNESGVVAAPDQYIRDAIDYFIERFLNIVFIVCSDDMEYAKQIMSYKNITVEYVHITPIQDLAVLSSCDHVITTVGTFGWWAGFLSGGTVLYYKYPIREGSKVKKEYNFDDFFPDDWVGLE